MARVLLSDEQHDYIVQGVREDFRNDGRSCKDYRKFEISTGMITNANASARVKLVSTNDCTLAMICGLMQLLISLVHSGRINSPISVPGRVGQCREFDQV